MLWLPLSKPTYKLCEVHLCYIDQFNLRTSLLTFSHNGSFIMLCNLSAGFSVMYHLDKRSAILLSEPGMYDL